MLASVHPEIVDFGSGHVSRRSLQAKTEGRSFFATAGVARYVEDCKKALVPPKPWQRRKNAVLGRKMPFMDGH